MGFTEDVICKLHRYSVKEAVHAQASIDFNGARLALFPDLSERTLMQRRAVHPVLDVLRAVNVSHC